MKRIIDLIISSAGILIFAPLILLVSVLILIFLGNPIIYTQIRPGLIGKPFNIYKFRTMTQAKDLNCKLLSDEKRSTFFGRILRKTSLDELPSMWNVLKGDMSFVGPRPLLMEYLDRYSPEQARRHEVKPGITGWAQVNGRNAISWEEKFKLDVWYVDHQSFWLDIKILCLTIWKVLKREGISHDGHVTMKPFQGNH